MQNVDGRTIVVTGASAGVGRAIVRRFAREGARIGLIARDAAALEDVRAEVDRLGGTAYVAACDVADAEALFAAADEIEAALGPIELWVNDAMATVFAPVWEMSPEEFRRATEVTYLGCVHGSMAALRHMRPRNRGQLIQIGSALAYRGIPLQAAYCGAKHAIRGFTNSLRTELIHEGSDIDVTIVELPAVNTPQFDWARTHMPRQPRPVAPVFQPEAIADIVLRAALHPRREYWIGRSTLELVLGNFVLPGFFDNMLAKKAYDGQEGSQPTAPDRRDNLRRPVHDLHRTRGRFGDEAASRAVSLPGEVARIAPVVVGGALMVGLGLIAGRAMASGQPRVQALPKRPASPS